MADYGKPEICRECGMVFVPGYDYDSNVYCSEDCKKRNMNRRGSKKRGKKLRNRGKYDPTISLKKLVQKHNGICQLCDQPIDWNDKSESEAGIFLAGDTYPSIDHIKPLGSGGTHTWNNVQLAHRKCNNDKADLLIK